MKEFFRTIVKKIVLFGIRDDIRHIEQTMAEQSNLLASQANSIQYFAETLAEKSYLIDCNANEIKQRFFEIKKLAIQLREGIAQTTTNEIRIFQVVPVFKSGDAIGNYALFIRKFMEDCGFICEIYCSENLSDIEEIKNIDDFPITNPKDIILLHMAAENDFAEIIEAYEAKKVLFYHNITPSKFFQRFDDFAEESTKKGRIQVGMLKSKVDACITVSQYNKKELEDIGYNVPIFVVPIPFEKEAYVDVESQNVKRCMLDGKKNILFVGRIAPNKKIEDLIGSYQEYYDNYDQNVRLILLGRYNEDDKYYQYLKEKVRPQDDIVFTGHLKNDEWITYYKYADLFLCLSEHEGFCVPLVEAMSYQIPIVAYNSSAVEETLGDGGILLESKTPNEVARVIHQTFCDEKHVDKMKRRQQEQVRNFDSKLVAKKLENIIRKLVEE